MIQIASTLVRLVALALIWGGATLAWIVLTVVLVDRTQQSDTAQRAALGSLWGPEQTQAAPQISCGKGKTFTVLPLTGSKLGVDLALDQRRKGLLWYNTYQVAFAGTYRVDNPGPARSCTFALLFPSDDGVYDDVHVLVNGKRVENAASFGSIEAPLALSRAASALVDVAYTSRGVSQWKYSFGSGVSSVRNFTMLMHTNFAAIDFPLGTMAPTTELRTPSGWDLTWTYRDLITGNGVGMVMPELLQPGPLAQRITMWAPLSLLFYFFVMFIITTVRRIDLHPMNYFFLAAAFFAFQLLFAYTVDRMPIVTAFVLCSVVSLFLTITYLRLVVGLRFAAVEAGLAQLVYQILFSLALFNEGSSGLTITIGAILTLFVSMQLTGRIDWSELFRRGAGQAGATPTAVVTPAAPAP